MSRSRLRPMARLVRLAALVSVALLLGASVRAPGHARAQSGVRSVGTQDVWLITALRVTSADGATTDVTDQLLAAAGSAAGATTDLGDGFVYTDAPALSGRALDDSGAPLVNVGVRFGVIKSPSGSVVAAITSPDVTDTPVNLAPGGRVSLDADAIAGLPVPTGGSLSYLFLQTLTPADPADEAGLDDAGVFARRWREHEFQTLGLPGEDGTLQPGIVVDAPLDAAALTTTGAMRPAGAAYTASDSALAWQTFAPDALQSLARLPNEIGALLMKAAGNGRGAVSPGQAARSNDPLATPPCDPVCTLTLTATGNDSFVLVFTAPLLQTVELHATAQVGRATGWRIAGASGSDVETFTPRAAAAGCTPAVAADAGGNALTTLAFQSTNVGLQGRLDHDWLIIEQAGPLDPPQQLDCIKPEQGGFFSHYIAQVIHGGAFSLATMRNTYVADDAVPPRAEIAPYSLDATLPSKGTLNVQWTLTP